jgi:hypothetical protein
MDVRRLRVKREVGSVRGNIELGDGRSGFRESVSGYKASVTWDGACTGCNDEESGDGGSNELHHGR